MPELEYFDAEWPPPRGYVAGAYSDMRRRAKEALVERLRPLVDVPDFGSLQWGGVERYAEAALPDYASGGDGGPYVADDSEAYAIGDDGEPPPVVAALANIPQWVWWAAAGGLALWLVTQRE